MSCHWVVAYSQLIESSLDLHVDHYCLLYDQRMVLLNGGSRISHRGGVDLVGGGVSRTPKAAMFRKICMSK